MYAGLKSELSTSCRGSIKATSSSPTDIKRHYCLIRFSSQFQRPSLTRRGTHTARHAISVFVHVSSASVNEGSHSAAAAAAAATVIFILVDVDLIPHKYSYMRSHVVACHDEYTLSIIVAGFCADWLRGKCACVLHHLPLHHVAFESTTTD